MWALCVIKMTLECVGNYLMISGLVLLSINHLVFKYFVLKRLKEFHFSIFEILGQPTIFSMKESMWSLIGHTGDIDVKQYLESESNSEITLKLLNKYRISTYIEWSLIIVGTLVLIVNSNA